MSYDNPYSAPKSSVSGAGSGGVSEEILTSLRQTKPWVRFFSVLSFIMIAFMALAALGSIGGSLMLSGAGSDNGSGMVVVMLAMGVVYLLMGLLYFFPALYLWQYASAIGRLLVSEDSADLEEALYRQKAFWKFVGVMTVVMLALGVVAAILLPSLAIFMASEFG